MHRETLLEHLKQAERHVAEGERLLDHQRGFLKQLRSKRHSEQLISAAERLLRSFEEVQSMHLADVDRLRRELKIPG